MKTGIALIALLTLVVSVNAQENDDMYFNSKDRVKVNATKSALANTLNSYDDETAQTRINPTDSYSARSVNPEYVARTKFNSGSQQTDAQYFVSGYQPPVSVNQSLYNTNSNFYNNPYYYGNSAFNNPYYGYGSGMYGSPYSSFYNPYMMGSMYNSGMYSSLGYMWGGMGSGLYGGMGYGNMWGSPSSMFWNNYYGSSYYGYGYGSSMLGYGYRPTVVIVNSNNGDSNSGVSYGRRVDRSAGNSNLTSHTRPDISYTRNGRSTGSANSAGRVSSSQSDYYDRSWKRNPDISPARSSWSGNNGSSSNGFGRTSWSGNNTNSGSHTSSWGTDSGARSSWGNSGSSFSTGGGGGRSSGGGGGSVGGGATRGRH